MRTEQDAAVPSVQPRKIGLPVQRLGALVDRHHWRVHLLPEPDPRRRGVDELVSLTSTRLSLHNWLTLDCSVCVVLGFIAVVLVTLWFIKRRDFEGPIIDWAALDEGNRMEN